MMRSILKFVIPFCVAASVTLAPHGASAAETFDQAVEELARQFAARKDPAAPKLRVAVTAFRHADQRPTQFSNFLMVALTGKMVELGSDRFRVIERAQLETALREIETGQVPVFDASTSQELGKAVGADTLVVGEVTILSDTVRIDARLIDVDTIETIEQARTWIPLTPSVQKQIETIAVPVGTTIGDSGPDARTGIWNGRGECGDASVGVVLATVVNPDGTVTALQTYFPLNGNGESGTFTMEGTVDPATQVMSLKPSTWVFQPKGHGSLGIEGTFDLDRRSFEGRYAAEGCGAVTLKKM